MNYTILGIVIVYLIVITAVIVQTGKKVRTYYDFALGGGQIPWYIVTGTMFASTVGGATMIGYVGSYKQLGLQWGLVPLAAFCIGSILIGLLIASRLKNLNQYTTADLFYLRYGKTARIIAALLNCLGEMAVVASMMASFGTMATGYLGIDYKLAMVIAVVIFYVTATMGGLRGVAFTDTIQGIVIFITVTVVAIISFGRIQDAGGFSQLPANLLNPFAENLSWKTMLGNILSGALMGMVMQSLFVQRINACRNPHDAKKAATANGILCGIFMIGGIGIIGLSAYFTTPPEVTGNDVITSVLSTMPSILGAFYAAAILAAVLTTANSLLLSVSMTFVRDFLGSFKKMEDKQELRVSRIFILVIDLLAFLVVQYADGVLAWILITYTILGCLAVPLYGGLLSKKTTPASGILSLVLGGGGAIVWEVLKAIGALPESLSIYHSIFPGIILGFVGLFIGMAFPHKSSPEQLRVVDCFIKNQSYHSPEEAK